MYFGGMVIEEKIKTAPVLLNKLLFTVDEYYQMAEIGILKSDVRYELIEGEIITMSPIKSLHASITDDVFAELNHELYQKAIIRSQNPIHIDKYNEPEPDITIVKYQKHKYRSQHPQPEDIYFLIEVSDSTLHKDRTIKRALYAKAGIPEYWIVNIPDEQIEVYQTLQNDDYQEVQIFGKGEVVPFEVLGFELKVKDLFF